MRKPYLGEQLISQVRKQQRPDRSQGFAVSLYRALKRVIKGKVAIERQKIIYGYIVDFYIPELNLVFEADGPDHQYQHAIEYDDKRDSVLRLRGIQTIRFGYRFMGQRREVVEDSIRDALNRRWLELRKA